MHRLSIHRRRHPRAGATARGAKAEMTVRSEMKLKSNRLIGAALRRTEDPRFLLGRGSYVDDIQQSGVLHAAFFRSDVSHGILTSLDTAEARKVPGVVAVFDAHDVASLLRPL